MAGLRGVAAVVLVAALAACDADPVVRTPAPSERTIDGSHPSSATPVGPGDWPTYHRDQARSGVAPGFPTLGTLHQAWRSKLDGAVYGQPLFIGDTLFAATEHDTVYALDAGTGQVRWSAHLGEPMPGKQLPCGNIDPLGITSTMVYDPDTGVVFALAETLGAHHTLYGLDARTGAVRVSRAAEPPQGDPVAHQQRAALNLLDGRVYLAYGGLAGDCGQYIGSVVSVPTTGNGALASYAVPTPREGGIWAPGGGSVHNGQLLYAVGNGESGSGSGYDGSDSVLRLDRDLKLVDRFSPVTWAEDNDADLDLGSLTAVVVNGYVFADGKRGTAYTLRPDHLGGIGGQVGQGPVCKAYGGPVVDGDTIYVPCRDGVRAVRVEADGQVHVRWQAAVPARGSPVLGGGAVWVVDYDAGVLYALDPATGAVRQQLPIGKAPHFASPTLAKGRAYVGTLDGVTAVSPS
jgi:polyvinyl alcohol dehydrogenase (cytochrome)